MYYLFLRKPRDLVCYKRRLLDVLDSIEKGKTPVLNEVSCAKTNLIECFPMNFIAGVFSILGALLLAKVEINEILKVAVIMIINSLCWNISNFIFTMAKHQLRLKLCKRLKLIPTDRLIAAMESLEYQSV